MSFYTALSGLNGAQADISNTSNNIANVSTTGFKGSRVEFGDFFSSSPMQNSDTTIGSGTMIEQISEVFTQGSVMASQNTLDLAIQGQGFFALRPSLTSGQTVFTRSGEFSVDNDRYVVDAGGQHLMTYPVNADGTATSYDLSNSQPLRLAMTSGAPNATSQISLGVNLPATANLMGLQSSVPPSRAFSPDDPTTFAVSTTLTVYDSLGNANPATVYFIKQREVTFEDPTSAFEIRVLVDGIELETGMSAVESNTGENIFVDRFGNPSTLDQIGSFDPTGLGAPLYLENEMSAAGASTSGMAVGAESYFDFGIDGSGTVEIVTDPLMFKTTREGGSTSTNAFWGRDFLLVNIDESSEPVSIDIRQGTYSAADLAAEVERAVNDAYGDDKDIEITPGVDDALTIDFMRLKPDGTSESLTDPVSINLLGSSYVSDALGVDMAGAAPEFTTEAMQVHMKARVAAGLNNYLVDPAGDISSTHVDALGVDGTLFGTGFGNPMSAVYQEAEVVTVAHNTYDGAAWSASDNYMVYGWTDDVPNVSVFENKTALVGLDVAGAVDPAGDAVTFNAVTGELTINVDAGFAYGADSSVVLAGTFADPSINAMLNGRTLTISSVVETTVGASTYKSITIDASELGLSDADFAMVQDADISVYSSASEDIEAYFRGAQSDVSGDSGDFSSMAIALREIGPSATRTAAYFGAGTNVFDIGSAGIGGDTALGALGLKTFGGAGWTDSMEDGIAWVDERTPPVDVTYDTLEQRFEFDLDARVFGTGSTSDFYSFRISGADGATSTNGLGLPTEAQSAAVTFDSGAVWTGESFVADGTATRNADNRYGIDVNFNSATGQFTIESGSTGEAIEADAAVGAPTAQTASRVQVGRHAIGADGIVDPMEVFDPTANVIGLGGNAVFGFGGTIAGARFDNGSGLDSTPATVTGSGATFDMSSPFQITDNSGTTSFSVTVDGLTANIILSEGNYDGDSLAATLQARINQLENPTTGQPTGGVSVVYSAASNNLTFTSGTTGDAADLRVSGDSTLGLAGLAASTGSSPMIQSLVQATNSDGALLYLDAAGNIVTEPPAEMMEGYFPLYQNDGLLSFDSSGSLLNSQTAVSFLRPGGDASNALEIDFAGTTQLAQAFAVTSVSQDGYATGNLDGVEVDDGGSVWVSYSNGRREAVGKVILASFANENGLKKIGNSSYMSTAESGIPIVGESGEAGYGSILSGFLESSNVDLSSELVNLITAQRNYQASAKSIETMNTLVQTLMQIRA